MKTVEEAPLIRMCIDRVIEEEEHLLRGAKLATAENPANRPDPHGAQLLMKETAPFPGPLMVAYLTSKLWRPNRVLDVHWMGGTLQQRAFVENAAREWENWCGLRFKFGASRSAAEIRCSFDPRVGSWSHLGTNCLLVPPGQATMNFGWLDHATVLHEFGHAIGMVHEHQSPAARIPWDWPAVYRFYAGPPNFWSKEQVDMNIRFTYREGLTQFSAFDRHSVMLYPIDARLTRGHYVVGWNQGLSSTDREWVGRVYPKRAGPVA